MHLKPNALGLSGAILVAVCYLVESLTYMFAPNFVHKVWSIMCYRMSFAPLATTAIDWTAFGVGLVGWVVMTYVGLAVFALLYNKMAK